jgi:uncharacterized repeat protein (TIGR03803 family)
MAFLAQPKARTICRIVRSVASRALPVGTACTLLLLAALPARAQSYSVLYSFAGGTDGGSPFSALILDPESNLYGTASAGGISGNGVVFEIGSTGNETVLHNFAGSPTDGAIPYAGLVRSPTGDLYGTTFGGGAYGNGTAFRLTFGGKETVLHSFTAGIDGGYPVAAFVNARGGLYGASSGGGAFASACGGLGCGVLFKLGGTGTETILHEFAAYPSDGFAPQAAVLTLDRAGNLYGTTYKGGAYGAGTVFKASATGKESVLYSFTGGADGANPYSSLTLDAAGNLYGTTSNGGAYGNGAVFELSPSGQETVLYSFGSNGFGDGGNPEAGLVRDEAGNLYGTTAYGGAGGSGAVYKVDPSGTETLLHSFTDGTDGGYPVAGLVMDSAGNLYGTTVHGGSYGYGVVFKIVP